MHRAFHHLPSLPSEVQLMIRDAAVLDRPFPSAHEAQAMLRRFPETRPDAEPAETVTALATDDHGVTRRLTMVTSQDVFIFEQRTSSWPLRTRSAPSTAAPACRRPAAAHERTSGQSQTNKLNGPLTLKDLRHIGINFSYDWLVLDDDVRVASGAESQLEALIKVAARLSSHTIIYLYNEDLVLTNDDKCQCRGCYDNDYNANNVLHGDPDDCMFFGQRATYWSYFIKLGWQLGEYSWKGHARHEIRNFISILNRRVAQFRSGSTWDNPWDAVFTGSSFRLLTNGRQR
ncbi:hypothetical protein ISF_01696 [Cordyceps fumosorosea ARSEF 2679]|uniref:Uncharacterized protein n=1 Tax=Cordyceps fumosorosea (strain ARSEF 2679) TaxID=1081104 RepID=A0A168CAA8_CORFA|nr:hypothetical protein ISF_01696 [Cordyceps fumosorosea ARSEF 2679]OAA71145.1 hypothetical protein ISF_01696 [Cordyceps fumosorosea ARSEF 2679]